MLHLRHRLLLVFFLESSFLGTRFRQGHQSLIRSGGLCFGLEQTSAGGHQDLTSLAGLRQKMSYPTLGLLKLRIATFYECVWLACFDAAPICRERSHVGPFVVRPISHLR